MKRKESKERVVTPEEFYILMQPICRCCARCGQPFLKHNKVTFKEYPCIDGYDLYYFEYEMDSALDYCPHCHSISRDLTRSIQVKDESNKDPEYLSIALDESLSSLEKKYKLALYTIKHGNPHQLSASDIRMGLFLYYEAHGKTEQMLSIAREELASCEDDVYLIDADLQRRMGDFDAAAQALTLFESTWLMRRIKKKCKARDTSRILAPQPKEFPSICIIPPRFESMGSPSMFILCLPLVLIILLSQLIWGILAGPCAVVIYLVRYIKWRYLHRYPWEPSLSNTYYRLTHPLPDL